MGGRKNDRSAFCVLKLIEKNKVTKSIVDGKEITSVYKYYDRELIYIESHEGMLLRKQAERLKELYTDFDASYIVVDAQNAGEQLLCLNIWKHICRIEELSEKAEMLTRVEV